jgi:hypothetical protein
MEKAIFITSIQNLKYVKEGYSRLYFGNEFCERRIPSLASLEEVISYVKKYKLDLSLVTPYITNDGLVRLEALFELLKKKGIFCEVVFNDWGILNLINHRYPNFEPVLGRLLTRQKRGPNIIRLLQRKRRKFFTQDHWNPNLKLIIIEKELPLGLDSYYKSSNAASVPIIHQFLLSQRIRRIELDNTQQGLLQELPRGKISTSIYFPYIYISTTFFCPSAGCDSKKKSFLKIKPCSRQCQRYIFTLRNRSFHKVIFLKGNTHFYKNSKISYKALAKIGVDRVVYEPEMPV